MPNTKPKHALLISVSPMTKHVEYWYIVRGPISFSIFKTKIVMVEGPTPK